MLIKVIKQVRKLKINVKETIVISVNIILEAYNVTSTRREQTNRI